MTAHLPLPRTQGWGCAANEDVPGLGRVVAVKGRHVARWGRISSLDGPRKRIPNAGEERGNGRLVALTQTTALTALLT